MRIHVSLAVMVLLVDALLLVDAQKTNKGPRKYKAQPLKKAREEISNDLKKVNKQKGTKSGATFEAVVQPDPSGKAQEKNEQKKKKSSGQPKEAPSAGHKHIVNNNNSKRKQDRPTKDTNLNNGKPIKASTKKQVGEPKLEALLGQESVEVKIDVPYNSSEQGFQETDQQNDDLGVQEIDGQNDNTDLGAEVIDEQNDNPDLGAEVTDEQNGNPDLGVEVTDQQNDNPNEEDNELDMIAE